MDSYRRPYFDNLMRKAAYDIKDVDDKNEKLSKQNNKLNMKSCPLLPKPDCKGYQN